MARLHIPQTKYTLIHPVLNSFKNNWKYYVCKVHVKKEPTCTASWQTHRNLMKHSSHAAARRAGHQQLAARAHCTFINRQCHEIYLESKHEHAVSMVASASRQTTINYSDCARLKLHVIRAQSNPQIALIFTRNRSHNLTNSITVCTRRNTSSRIRDDA